ncbi:GNAT family N-acetyltransferase [Pontibacter cellulosilyticus]|uniref:GNAT family N-acetyltransferase n=1 Tax=Pontibacter cellulosilyticus TaxID=1720253 RepID=A0A923N4N3_9BACT|nr:GNAT family N-acetyltransferase [Pontibacter cellulosilyticus]MBC5991662.1 GNAT family N-acetyltransferase [Pontibacter cellulosilyticus]
MTFREATVSDIPQIQKVRHSVRENILSDPTLVTDQHCEDYLTKRGKGWVCEIDGEIVGFAIADLQECNVWALFLKPEHEGNGIGKQLQNIMLNWYFSQTTATIWLGTGFNTRAEEFYRRQGWEETGLNGSDETRFEMSYNAWRSKTLIEQ